MEQGKPGAETDPLKVQFKSKMRINPKGAGMRPRLPAEQSTGAVGDEGPVQSAAFSATGPCTNSAREAWRSPHRLRATSVTEAETRQTSFRVSVLFAAKAHRPSGGPDGSFTNEDAITRHNGSGIHLPPAHARGLSVSDKA